MVSTYVNGENKIDINQLDEMFYLHEKQLFHAKVERNYRWVTNGMATLL